MPTEGRMHAIGFLFSFHRDFCSCDHQVIFTFFFLFYFVVDSVAFIYVVRVIFFFLVFRLE